FRPEQKDWKKMVRSAPVEPTTDPAVAAKRLMTDDNFFLGTLYKGDRAPYQPELKTTIENISELDRGFIL
ncbi:MAG: 2-oxoacid:ferredoxin oxidoreductase subunit beta, partial [Sedimenticola sp.]|nr:2-oxoacid:ferredoxin oxidoreductase subunit beta [Sedimenticola sp.]